jgi:hypothetical protein
MMSSMSWPNALQRKLLQQYCPGISTIAARTGNAVSAGGDGTTAIIGIGHTSRTAAHVVVLTNQDGNVGIIEGQDWGSGKPPKVITNPADANNRYNSDGGSNFGWGLVP